MDSSALYRIENHTLQKFQIKQVKGLFTYFSKSKDAVTPILPYYMCLYAWDEPMQPHMISIESVSADIKVFIWINIWIYIPIYMYKLINVIHIRTYIYIYIYIYMLYIYK
jgi:hypothetical protein